jgi:hypothetical protein
MITLHRILLRRDPVTMPFQHSAVQWSCARRAQPVLADGFQRSGGLAGKGETEIPDGLGVHKGEHTSLL